MQQPNTETNAPGVEARVEARLQRSLLLAAEVGTRACERGAALQENPYLDDRDLAWAWNLGWREGLDQAVVREMAR